MKSYAHSHTIEPPRNRRRRPRTITVLLVALTLAPAVVAQEPGEILGDAAFVGRFSSLQAEITMEIHDRGSKSRTLELFVQQSPEEQKVLAQVVAPAFLNRMKFLTIVGESRLDQWMSTSRGVRRVAQGSRNERLFDSDFTLEDFAPPNPDNYDLTVLPDERVDGELCHVVRVDPVDIRTDYAYRVIYVSQEDRLLVRARYFNDSDELIRLFELQERMNVGGNAFPARATMRTLTEDTYTTVLARDVETDVNIPARIFSRGNLQ